MFPSVFPSAGPTILTFLPLIPLVLSLPFSTPAPAQDAPGPLDNFIPFDPLARRTDDAALSHSFWVHRSKLDQMERRVISSHRFDDTAGTQRVGTTVKGRSASLDDDSHLAPPQRRSLGPDTPSSIHRDPRRDNVILQHHQKRQDQTLGDFVEFDNQALAGAKVLFATTVTQGGAGAQATGLSGGGAMMVEVVPSTNDIQTAAGTITESCLTMVSDPTQKFCETILNGQRIGSDAGIPQAPPSPPPPPAGPESASAAASPTESSGDTGIAAAVVTDSASASASASGETPVSASASASDASVSPSIGAVVNAADPTSSSSDASASDSASPSTDPSASSSNTQGTGSPVVVNDPAATASNAQSPSAIMLNAPTAQAAEESSSETLITAPSSTPSVVVINAPPAQSSAAAAAAQENNAASTIPGQKMQVLPIGLGIFGGLAGITLLVVGYVYWERRKYKRQFRARKAAEKSLMERAAPMGSGGYGAA